ncbi:MAG: zinc ribbon domain-containing protein [Lachnospiraceae bacterium]|nr:zinc ribbon domain-containing protein [uncultured Lachnoanaerobaculum sp.]RKW37722.1 MAG: zinc ribbon domain-containing protein [Lachnospiraceae bacterium]
MATVIYKCKNCGGPVKYSATLGKFNCEYCNTVYSEDEVKALTLLSEREDVVVDAVNGDYVEYHCPSCGANIVTDETTVATNCYYCNNPIVMSGKLESSQMPTKVIPFRVDKKKALESFESWIKTKKFVPKSFFNDKQEIEEINGVYFPYWLYNTNVLVDIDREGSRTYTRTEGDYRVTYRKDFRIVRKGDIDVKNLPKLALAKSNKVLVESVYPFDFNNAINFDSSYLSGFVAEKKDIEKEALMNSIEDDVYKYSTKVVRDSMTGESVNVVNNDFTIGQGSFEYAMLPVWAISYNDRDSNKHFFFSVNGQTGKVVGKLPIDNAKLYLSGLMAILPLFLIINAILYFTGNLQTGTFLIALVGSIIAYLLYVHKVHSDYNMTSSGVVNRGVNQIDFNNNYAEKIEYCKDIDLGTRVISRSRIERK